MYTGLIYGYPRPEGGFYYVGQTRNLKRRHQKHCLGVEIPFDRFLIKVMPVVDPIVLRFIVCCDSDELSNLLDKAEEDMMMTCKTFRPKFPEQDGWNFLTPRGVNYKILSSLGGIASNKNPLNRSRLSRVSNFETCSKGGKLGGLTNVRSGQALSLGLLQGKKNKENGHWGHVRILGQAGSSERGKIQGKKNVESGHLARISRLVSTESRIKAGRIGGKKGGVAANHLRWHIGRGVLNPKCSLCIKYLETL